jgi:hypothetical protein
MRSIAVDGCSAENMDRLLSLLPSDSLAWRLLTALRGVKPLDWTRSAGEVLQKEIIAELISYGDGTHQ